MLHLLFQIFFACTLAGILTEWVQILDMAVRRYLRIFISTDTISILQITDCRYIAENLQIIPPLN